MADTQLNKLQEEKEQKGTSSPSEDLNFVMDGAMLQCKYAAAPAQLKVTSNQIKLQGKFWATEMDCTNTNIMFSSPCMHSCWGTYKPPCVGVMALIKWENTGNIKVQNYKPLLKSSTIKCAISGEDIEIIFDGQISKPGSFKTIGTIVMPKQAETYTPETKNKNGDTP
ncbi:MAG: DUF4280 domain-containing protein [Tannerellaceae bacterium]|nr:DUF4280 domain-containing protein [Tannerellaceae bacterium]